MHLELDADLARELKGAVDSRLAQLRDELAHTEQRDLRHSLRVTVDRLEEVQRRLSAALPSAVSERTGPTSS